MKQQAHIVVGLGYGDEGKGTMVDALVRKTGARTVVRFNGGAQAGHHVVTPADRQHTFSQFGSGTFVPGCRTILSRYMIVHPTALLVEAERLAKVGVYDAMERMFVDERALVNTPYHQAFNRLTEIARGNNRHGTVGVGVGDTVQDSIRYRSDSIICADLYNPDVLRRKLRLIRGRKLDEGKHLLADAPQEREMLERPEIFDRILELYAEFAKRVNIGLFADLSVFGDLVFEGAQGVLLDEWYGWHPYTTWTTCTSENALKLLRESEFVGDKTVIGVLRAYSTRHGPGPFVSEDKELTELLPDTVNKSCPWQREFRVGWFDTVASRYAIDVDGSIDYIALTNVDRLAKVDRDWRVVDTYHTPIGNLTELPLYHQDLEAQEQMGKELLSSRPGTWAMREPGQFLTRVRHYRECLQMALRKPIKVLSFGPTADDKAW